MAAITTYLTADKDRKFRDVVTPVWRTITLAAGNQNDTISLESIKPGEVVMGGNLHQSATLGAGCTLTLRIDTTALTAATTAAAASGVAQTIACPTSTDARTLNILIAGAAVGATATVTVSYLRVQTVS